MNPYHAKLAAAEQILRADSLGEMTQVLTHWPLFFNALCPAFSQDAIFDMMLISESYETLRQRAHEFLTNHRLNQIEERLNSISHESS